jgi:hypothetical protein
MTLTRPTQAPDKSLIVRAASQQRFVPDRILTGQGLFLRCDRSRIRTWEGISRHPVKYEHQQNRVLLLGVLQLCTSLVSQETGA